MAKSVASLRSSGTRRDRGKGQEDEKGVFFFHEDLPDEGQITTREEEDVPDAQQDEYIFPDDQETEPKDEFGTGWQSDPCGAVDEDDPPGVKFDWDDDERELTED